MFDLRGSSVRSGVVAGSVLAVILTACAHTESAQHSILADRSRLAEAIGNVDQPDAGWIAAMYAAGLDDRAASAHLARSTVSAGSDPVTAFAALQACSKISGCDVRAAAANLRTADPRNGFSTPPELASALAADDSHRIDAALDEMARASGWNVYWNPAITRATSIHMLAARALPREDAGELKDVASAHATATGVMAGMLIPVYNPISAACKVEVSSPRHAHCIQVARGLQKGDAVITQSFGYSLEVKLFPVGTPERQAAADRRRALMWLLRSQDPTTRRSADEFRHLQAAQSREDDVFREILRRRGKPTEPPPGWDPAAG